MEKTEKSGTSRASRTREKSVDPAGTVVYLSQLAGEVVEVNEQGRVTIPVRARDEMGLSPGRRGLLYLAIDPTSKAITLRPIVGVELGGRP